MTNYTLEREYKIHNSLNGSTVRVRPGVDNGIIVNGLVDGISYSIEEANAIAHAILHCIEDIQHFQRKVDEKLLPEGIPDRDGWIEHTGKFMPVASETMVEVKFRNGDTNDALAAGAWHADEPKLSNWVHNGGKDDIVRYRIVS